MKITDKISPVSWNSKNLELGFIFMLIEFNFILQMVSGTNFVVMRTELIKKHNVIEPEKGLLYRAWKACLIFTSN